MIHNVVEKFAKPGINDTPALAVADVCFAMGISFY
jgi:high-affinity K+ transport system ATPase subunit B